METFCKKDIDYGGNICCLEYKMLEKRTQIMDIGEITMYGMRIKLYGFGEFQYACINEICSKPQKILQLIKYMFDKCIVPNEAEIFLSAENNPDV